MKKTPTKPTKKRAATTKKKPQVSSPSIEYSSNNSGGRWWLTDAQWKALERAGWEVEWGGVYFCHSGYRTAQPPVGKPMPCATRNECRGHRRCDSAKEAEKTNQRFIGALATRATRRGLSYEKAIAEWERITGENADDEGCPCCGAPHYFIEESER